MTLDVKHEDGKRRCAWCTSDPLYLAYHDDEWGVPLHDDRRLFEMLCLEGAQAGLSWLTILRKRENYRAAFDHFDAEKMARYGARKRSSLLNDAGIVRNRLKVDAFIDNARAYLDIRARSGGFSGYLWQFTGGEVQVRRPRGRGEYRTSTPESDAMSKDLKNKGFRFVGTTICYAFMQAVGIVDEHQRLCWRAASRSARVLLAGLVILGGIGIGALPAHAAPQAKFQPADVFDTALVRVPNASHDISARPSLLIEKVA